MSQRTLYLHIGFHKTGSTSIQEFLASNKEMLKDLGYFCPTGHMAPGAHYGIPAILAETKESKIHATACKKDKEVVWEQILSTKHPKIILSSETFCRCDPNKVKQLFAKYNVKIIAYIRNFPDFVLSMYNQTIRRQLCDYTDSLQTFIDNEKEDLLSRYQALFDWSNVFGEENVSIVPFEKQQLTKNNVISDFLEKINIDSNIFSSYTPPHVNKSTSNESLYLIRAINLDQGINHQERLKLTRQIIEWDRNRTEKNQNQLSLITTSELDSLRIYS